MDARRGAIGRDHCRCFFLARSSASSPVSYARRSAPPNEGGGPPAGFSSAESGGNVVEPFEPAASTPCEDPGAAPTTPLGACAQLSLGDGYAAGESWPELCGRELGRDDGATGWCCFKGALKVVGGGCDDGKDRPTPTAGGAEG